MSRPYDAPIARIRTTLDRIAAESGLEAALSEETKSSVEAVLTSAAQFGREVLSPLNPIGDRSPARLEDGRVRTSPGFREAYRRFAADGWTSLLAPPESGGQGLPLLLDTAVNEMWAAANLSFAMCPQLASGASMALRLHGSPELKDELLRHFADGSWATAMALSEPQAGSDLSAIRTTARADGESWRLSGQKIYVSWGDHDFVENIALLVLARTEDAPGGIRGLSLFMVPRFENDVRVVSIEHKMGVRASPTCALVFGEAGGARGQLVGEQHRGLECMFTMMNYMRLGVAIQSVGLAERAFQLARGYAMERIQGRDASGVPCAIVEHADVRRMLLQMQCLVQAARCVAYFTAAQIDLRERSPQPQVREAAGRLANLLTPIAKGWCSEIAVEVSSLGVQIHGGAGYLDDSEISQIYRDARIGPIFEGTNYMQARDLLLRNIIPDRGAALFALLDEIEGTLSLAPVDVRMAPLRKALARVCARARTWTTKIIERHPRERELVGAIASTYLRHLATLIGGWQLMRCASHAERIATSTVSASASAEAQFYAIHILPRIRGDEAIFRSGAAAIPVYST
jgi:alkylation response protein AidB-like acyl-CoA dehydrogenase